MGRSVSKTCPSSSRKLPARAPRDLRVLASSKVCRRTWLPPSTVKVSRKWDGMPMRVTLGLLFFAILSGGRASQTPVRQTGLLAQFTTVFTVFAGRMRIVASFIFVARTRHDCLKHSPTSFATTCNFVVLSWFRDSFTFVWLCVCVFLIFAALLTLAEGDLRSCCLS
jgi:hypothetical protein